MLYLTNQKNTLRGFELNPNTYKMLLLTPDSKKISCRLYAFLLASLDQWKQVDLIALMAKMLTLRPHHGGQEDRRCWKMTFKWLYIYNLPRSMFKIHSKAHYGKQSMLRIVALDSVKHELLGKKCSSRACWLIKSSWRSSSRNLF